MPSFISIDIIINRYKLFICLKKKNLSKNTTEAHLWIKKYFIEFSSSILILEEIIGKNLNIFSSKLIHIKKLELILKDKTIDIKSKK